MKKTVSILLALLCLLSLCAGCCREKAAELPVHVEGSLFGGSGKDSIGLTLRFDPKWITEGDSAAYNKELAAFAALVSADTYFRTKDLDRGTPNRVLTDGADSAKYDQTALLRALGFTDVQYVESYKLGTPETDPNDSVTMTLGYLNDRNKYDCFIIGVRGCFSAGEWYSIFDPGAETEAYAALTGAHPEWTDAALLKGLGVASHRAMALIDAYMAAHDDPARQNCVLVTGHSRGGALAEILGARFEDDPAVKSCAYTFNALPVTKDAEAGRYRTVFNLFDSGDFFSDCLPFKNVTFYRYGQTIAPAIGERADIRETIAKLKGADDYRCLSAEAGREYTELFGQLFPDRASLYEPLTLTRSFNLEADAAAGAEACRALIGAETGLGLDAFCSVSGPEAGPDGTYSYTLHYCRAAMLETVGRTLAYGQSACEAVKSLFGEEEQLCRLAELILQNAADITGGHRLLNSYALAGSVSGS